MQDKEQLEERVSELLTEGEMDRLNPDEAAVRRLSPRWEIRIRAQRDPIVSETIRYRRIADEVDDRYDHIVCDSDAPEDFH